MTPIATSPRVLVTDDSALMRRILAAGLSRLGLSVVGEAGSGDEALDLCRELRPDVLTLDLAMPGLDGVGVLRAMQTAGMPVPVVVVSSYAGGTRAVEALAEGAVELVPKPNAGDSLGSFLADLAATLHVAAHSSASGSSVPSAVAPPGSSPASARAPSVLRRVTVIACSTGGPRALVELLPALPPRLGEGAILIQHMPAGFTRPLAERLERVSSIRVAEAAGGERLTPGTIWVAPGGRHLRFSEQKTLVLSDEPPIGGLRPRADLTIGDAARLFGEKLLLVVLTGMGCDGMEGAREVKRRGGRVIAEAESSCVVYGMPRAVIEDGLADVVVPLAGMAAAVAREAGR